MHARARERETPVSSQPFFRSNTHMCGVYNFSRPSYKRIVETIQHKIDLLTDETRVQWHLLLGGSMADAGQTCGGRAMPLCRRITSLHVLHSRAGPLCACWPAACYIACKH